MTTTREQWLAERRTCVTATDLPRILRLPPYHGSCALEVYLEKVRPADAASNDYQAAGLELEPVIAAAYVRRTGRTLAPAQLKLWRRPEHPWAGASLDRWTEPGERRIVELKASGSREGWGEEGTDDIPPGYVVQTQWQMWCSGLAPADVALGLWPLDLLLYLVVPTPALIAILRDVARDFWRRVELRDPPPVDWEHPAAPELIAKLYRPEPGEVIDLGDQGLALANEYERLSAALTELRAPVTEVEKLRAVARAKLIELMGAAGTARLPDGRVIKRSVALVEEKQPRRYERETFSIRCPRAERQVAE